MHETNLRLFKNVSGLFFNIPCCSEVFYVKHSTIEVQHFQSVNGKKATGVAKSVRNLLLSYKEDGMRTITTDNGSEFATHEWISEHPDVPIYFTETYISCQKGVIENANKLIRQYIPKVMNISTVIDGEILKIQTNIKLKTQRKT